MSAEQRAKRAQLRGFLEMLRDKTKGADAQWVGLMHEADSGRLVWTGKSPLPRRRKK
jgi:hypothetical protein